ncbi:ABC transporter substrate-binding protein [Brevibacterium album]|uniref:ABC transporter substrate-binding protein n=1 Tax=Brevibacterium album TaxID=417948 RepID=UPI00041628C3|nr:iron-siderophore ABC transporter substrate-binding protein [Brevibacterium album]
MKNSTQPRSRALRSIVALAASLACLTVSACGSSASAGSGDGQPGGGESRTVAHAMGETVVEGEPSTIVVLDSPFMDALVSLGITPAGGTVADQGEGFPGYLGEATDGVETVGLIAEPDVDAVANLAPDLIIGTKIRHEAIYDELSAIAPTVYSETSGTNWEDQARLAAEAVGKSGEMDALIGEVEARAQELGEEVGAEGTTVSMVRFLEDNFRLYGPETFSGSILTDMGYELGDRSWNEYSMLELSPENYDQIDGDVIFYTSPGGDPAASTLGTVTDLWKDQPGVAAGQAFEVPEGTWMTGIGVTGAHQILDEIEERLGS